MKGIVKVRSRDLLDPVSVRTLVGDALDGKYPKTDEGQFGMIFETKFSEAVATDSESGLIERLAPVDSFAADVGNHIVTLHLIERYWRHAPPPRPLGRIHAAIYGHPTRPSLLRQTAEVADYGGRPPTYPSDVGASLSELELQVERIMPALNRAGVRRQAIFLAHLLSSVIRVHPFADGNGRAGRLIVQLCLRVWDQPFLPLPKVRNEPGWSDSLSKAVAGDIAPLVKELFERMERQTRRARDGR